MLRFISLLCPINLNTNPRSAEVYPMPDFAIKPNIYIYYARMCKFSTFYTRANLTLKPLKFTIYHIEKTSISLQKVGRT